MFGLSGREMGLLLVILAAIGLASWALYKLLNWLRANSIFPFSKPDIVALISKRNGDILLVPRKRGIQSKAYMTTQMLKFEDVGIKGAYIAPVGSEIAKLNSGALHLRGLPVYWYIEGIDRPLSFGVKTIIKHLKEDKNFFPELSVPAEMVDHVIQSEVILQAAKGLQNEKKELNWQMWALIIGGILLVIYVFFGKKLGINN